MKVLLFANDLMPFNGLPTSGGGLRCFQLYEGLRSHGVEVIASMPGFTYLAEKFAEQIPEEVRPYLWSYDSQDDILASVKPDAVIYSSNWDHYNLLKKPDVPLIIDLHGSRLIETAMWGVPVSGERKVSVFSQADLLLAAGKRQRLYFYGWLVQAGRVPESESFITYIPISLSPNIPEHFGSLAQADAGNHADSGDPKPVSQYPHFVSGGGWFPWQNQSSALFNIANAIDQRSAGRLEIFGTPHARQGNSSEEEQIIGIYQQLQEMSRHNTRLSMNDYISRDSLVERYKRADVAVELMKYNLERELAFTTRTIEYLWCGLPVVYNYYSEISEHIREYDAGWLCDPDGSGDLTAALEEIFTSPDVVRRKSENAVRLVRDRFTWDKTILPLVEFLRAPVRVAPSEPVLGSVGSRPSFLVPRGKLVEILLPSPSAGGKDVTLYQEFVVPAENVQGIEISVALTDVEVRCELSRVRLRVLRKRGGCLRDVTIRGANLPHGKVPVEFRFWRQPSGGEVLILECTVSWEVRASTNSQVLKAAVIQTGSSSASEAVDSVRSGLIIHGLEEAKFPFVAAGEVAGRHVVSNQQVFDAFGAQCLALSFIPAEFSQVYQLKLLCKRAWFLVHEAEWKRIVRALRKRVPQMQRLFVASFVASIEKKLFRK